ncbi:fasciclin domain-containing protein [Catalinimonas sp. 4WD22]|uniref:fasciclin domain-containing protein n=1 Tax=Catalinimonas locisalis TaxID=3133978 RepID=UPI0031018D63
MERPKEVIHTTTGLFHLQGIYFRLPGFVLFIFLSFLFYSPSYGQEGMVYEKTIQVDGVEREYLLYVPSTYSGQEEWPLVLNFHGFNSGPSQQLEISQMNALADAESFLVAYPQGLLVTISVLSETGPGWFIPVPEIEAEENQDDQAFVDGLIDLLDDEFSIDLSRIHATGWSMGSMMSSYLACALSEKIASVGGVGGAIPELAIANCDSNRPFSVLSIHGTADPIVPYEGVPDFIPPADIASALWANQNNCEQEPIITELPDEDTEDGSTVTRFDYPNCDEDTEVVLYRINEGGHTWPGGGPLPEFLGNINRDINASAIIWDFFERNPHPDLVPIPSGEVYKRNIILGNTMREYLLYVPAAYDGQEDWPLVLNFHGFNSGPEQQMAFSQMNLAADDAHFLVAYPAGLTVNNPLSDQQGPGWNVINATLSDNDDIDFSRKVVEHIAADYQVDHYKIHATGFSMGASMAYEIACLAPDLIASVAAVGGTMDQTIINRCERDKPISLLQIHGTDDPILPFDGIEVGGAVFPPAPETAAFWAEQSDCELEPESEDLPDNDTNDNSTVTLFVYQNCDDSEVLFYQVNGGGHSWPGGSEFPEFVGAVNRDFNASEEILAFFQRNPHPDLADGGPGELHEYSFMHDGIERNYLLYVPEDYDGQEDWPLVMVFHGFRIDGKFQMEVSQMNPVADKEKFLIAYPEGLPVLYPLTGEIGTGWIIPGAWEREEHQDDIGFASKVIDDVNDQYNIDLARVHATGWSNGSHFSFYLACELSDRVASAGGVGGHTTYALQSSCNAERPVSTILIHGTDDILVPYEGIPDLFPPIPTTPEYWVSQNNCSPEPTVTELPDINTEDNSTITRYQYTSCDDETEMDFYVMNDGGHTWPMGGWPDSERWGNVWPEFLGPVNQDINASQVIWDFFERNPFPAPSIHQLTLVNAKTEKDIQLLQDGNVLDLSELPRAHLNIRADVSGCVRSVKFELNGEEFSVENFEPYAMFGDQNGDYRSGKFKPGHYELKVTPYTASDARGDAGQALKINIQVVKSNTVADIVKRSSEYSILLEALKKSRLLTQLDSEGPYTLFAPDDIAFWKAFKVLGIKGVEQIPDYLLRKLLMYHLVNDQILTADISDGQELSSLLGLPLTLSRNQEYIFVNNAYITKADQEATNGVVHTISDLILPDVNALLFGLEALLEDREAAIASVNKQVLEIIASPNPGAREVSIITQGMVGKKLTVTIVNYSGLQTKQLEYDLSRKMEETRLDFTDFSKGMYIIHAQVGHLQKDFKVMR